jgi:hypothetical protein
MNLHEFAMLNVKVIPNSQDTFFLQNMKEEGWEILVDTKIY